MMRLLFTLVAVGVLMSCSNRARNDERLLWEYYSGFTYPPELFDSLMRQARTEKTKQFFWGMRCFEKYDQFDSVSCYDSARFIFDALIRDEPDSYLGYLGKGILLTERGRKNRGKGLPFRHYLDSAESCYRLATARQPNHGAVYYYRGRNQYNINVDTINPLAIAYLDTAAQFRGSFFKANERSAEFLSHYLDLSEKLDSNSHARFQSMFPSAEERIKYYFARSLAIDSGWYQTYQGIAKATHVYSARERIYFLSKGIALAVNKKSRDSLDLMLALLHIYHHDLHDFETARSLVQQLHHLDANAQKSLAWANYYLGEPAAETQQGFYNLRDVSGNEGWQERVQYAQLTGAYDSAHVYLDRWKKANPDRAFWADYERAKLLLRQQKEGAARALLREMVDRGARQWGEERFDHPAYAKAYFLLNYFEGY
ncbi:MAG: hypothetical protein MUC38_01190 [Cyclobacteriaceae bacterium]|jgi:hypothetical protein|nr:hypothetical protein [Cyclobacteriaceae bacterium]